MQTFSEARDDQRGFTLIELSIVLIIIGLLVGGVLQGQALVDNARVNSQGDQFDDAEVVLSGFVDRYNGRPGDIDNADTLIDDCAAACNGNGDGTIDGGWDAGTGAESVQFWAVLRNAEMWNDALTGTDLPQNKFNSDFGIDGAVFTGTVEDFTDEAFCTDEVDGPLAGALDSKFDDGAPDTGRIRAANADGYNGDTAATTYTLDANDGQYTICREVQV